MRWTRLVWAAAVLAALGAGASPSFGSDAAPMRASVSEVLSTASPGDSVTLEGRVVRKLGEQLFELQDDSGKVRLMIPEHLRRQVGEPGYYERIRVQGSYAQDLGEDGLSTEAVGVRVQQLLRPDAPSAEAPAKATTAPVPTLESADAQPLIDRLAAARAQVLEAERVLVEARERYARALHENRPEAGRLEAERDAAEQALAVAKSELPALADEAREAGVAETVIEMYRQGVSAE